MTGQAAIPSEPEASTAPMTPTFRLLRADSPDERAAWLGLWRDSPQREPSAHPAYAELFRGPADGALAATYSDGRGAQVLYPFILRPVGCAASESSLFDIISPYGYGGPNVWGTAASEDVLSSFWPEFDDWARAKGVVTEFIRFALLGTPEAAYPGEIVPRQANIVVSLEHDEDTLWRSFAPKVRKNVNRASRSGITVEVDLEGGRLDDFLRIYLETMHRRDAAEQYHFDREFFETIVTELRGSIAFFHAVRDSRVISTELVLVSSDAVYSFLGGTDAEEFADRPNDLLKYEIMRWAAKAGKRRFVLGGGASAGDGIERYKRAFAPHGEVTFRTGQRVFLAETYAMLTASLSADSTLTGVPGFFPAYRAQGVSS